MKHYTQLTEVQRYQISALRKEGLSQQAIALNIGLHPSTISRELRRSKGLRGYRPAQAQRKATERHRKKPKAIDADVYFAHPYASWDRGTNENMPERSDKCPWGANGLIRQYFPKGTRFEEITDEQIKIVQEKLNRRPRKTQA